MDKTNNIDKANADLAWNMFKNSGNPAHYLLYKRLSSDDTL